MIAIKIMRAMDAISALLGLESNSLTSDQRYLLEKAKQYFSRSLSVMACTLSTDSFNTLTPDDAFVLKNPWWWGPACECIRRFLLICGPDFLSDSSTKNVQYRGSLANLLDRMINDFFGFIQEQHSTLNVYPETFYYERQLKEKFKEVLKLSENTKNLNRILQEIKNGNISFAEANAWDQIRANFFMHELTFELIDDGILTIADTNFFSNKQLNYILTGTISTLLLTRKLAVYDVHKIQAPIERFHTTFLLRLCQQCPDLQDTILFTMPYCHDLFASIDLYNKLNELSSGSVINLFMQRRITLELFEKYSMLEVILIGIRFRTPEYFDAMSQTRRQCLKDSSVIHLVFRDLLKRLSTEGPERSDGITHHDSNALTEETADNNDYPVDFVIDLSDEHLSFLAMYADDVEHYGVMPRHISAISSEEMRQINEKLSNLKRYDATNDLYYPAIQRNTIFQRLLGIKLPQNNDVAPIITFLQEITDRDQTIDFPSDVVPIPQKERRKTAEELKGLSYADRLELPEPFTLEDLRKAREQAMLRYHPDKMTETSLSEEERKLYQTGQYMECLLRIEEAYDLLKLQFRTGNSCFSRRSRVDTCPIPLSAPMPNSPEGEKIFNYYQAKLEKIFERTMKYRGIKKRMSEFQISLKKIVQEIMIGNLTLEEVEKWDFIQKRNYTSFNFLLLMECKILTFSNVRRLTSDQLDQINKATTVGLLFHKKLTLDDFCKLNITCPYYLNNTYYFKVCIRRPDLINTIFEMPYGHPFFLATNNTCSLPEEFKAFLCEALILRALTLESFEKYSVLELILILLKYCTPAFFDNMIETKRRYFKNNNLVPLMFPHFYKGYSYSLCLMSEIGEQGPEFGKIYLMIKDNDINYRTHLTPSDHLTPLRIEISQHNGELYRAIRENTLTDISQECKAALVHIISKRDHTFYNNVSTEVAAEVDGNPYSVEFILKLPLEYLHFVASYTYFIAYYGIRPRDLDVMGSDKMCEINATLYRLGKSIHSSYSYGSTYSSYFALLDKTYGTIFKHIRDRNIRTGDEKLSVPQESSRAWMVISDIPQFSLFKINKAPDKRDYYFPETSRKQRELFGTRFY